ncbi:MAG: hypothetical protein B7Y36_10885 [Novosphingobium sp. 28-62-57]|nr:MAG: hypothetical protein B7Z34_14820 [Novosphingobium sp. 12-62-10]OYZ10247.1 MAG: hypothetical protein B7Y36_10885 [Novosphingobium sp. 28-62-57]OZA38036.1 MAG: hypothetical protein B7X92_04115 [Novosphingobium sp. 17-62-9]
MICQADHSIIPAQAGIAGGTALRVPAKAGTSCRIAQARSMPDCLVMLPEVPAFAGTPLEVLK